MRACGFGHRGHIDPPQQPDPPRRSQPARRQPRLGAGDQNDLAGVAPPYGRSPAVELLHPQHYPGRAHLVGGQRHQARTCVAREQRRGSDAENSWLGGAFQHQVARGLGARSTRPVDHRRLRPFRFSDRPTGHWAGCSWASVLPFCWSWVWPAMRWCRRACDRWLKSNKPPRQSPAVSWIAVCPNVIHEPRWAGCRWR